MSSSRVFSFGFDFFFRLPSASVCYAKATTVGRRLSEGGTHEETLRPQDQEEELQENKGVEKD